MCPQTIEPALDKDTDPRAWTRALVVPVWRVAVSVADLRAASRIAPAAADPGGLCLLSSARSIECGVGRVPLSASQFVFFE